MDNIKFGIDGWGSVIADGFTVDTLARITRATSRWLISRHKDSIPSVIIGYDTRFGGPMFAETVARVFAHGGIKVYLSDRYVSSPMVSCGVIHEKASLGIIITACHNPYNYNGFKLKGHYGGPLLDADIRNIENMVPELNEIHLESLQLNEFIDKKVIEYINLEEIYLNHIRINFDLDKISKSEFSFAFDAMYGSGQQVIQKLLPDITLLHCEQNYAFGGISPEPVRSNLKEFSSLIRDGGNIDCGLAVDGDADRAAVLDENGNYIDANNIMLLLIHYLHKYKGYEGIVVAGFSSTARIERLCSHYGIPVKRVRSVFREICGIMLKEKVLIGGEESGGISVSSCIPDRDGIWAGLLIFQFMVETGKTLRELIAEVYEITGSFAYERLDVVLDKNRKSMVIEKCRNGFFDKFGDRTVQKTETLDGFKYFFTNGEWLLIRLSYTEAVLRIYAESASSESSLEILNDARDAILEVVSE